MTMPESPLIGFGPFQVDSRQRALLQSGRPIHVTAKTFDLLLYFAQNRGRLIDKDELMSAVWQDSVIEESNLTVTISMLRRALGDSRKEHRYIVSVPRRGYRFTPIVTGLESGAAVQSASPAASPGAYLPRLPRLSIVVVPLRSVGPGRNDAFAESIVNTLVCRLARADCVSVRHAPLLRNDDPAAAAQHHGAAAMLCGAIEQSVERVRITLKLVRTRDSAVLWAEQFDEPLGDPMNMQDSIGERVATALVSWVRRGEESRLRRRDGCISAASQAYLKGRYFCEKRTEASLKQGISYFKEAIAHDARYPAAYLGLSDCYFLLSFYGALSPAEGYPKSKAAALRALELAPGFGLAHTSLGCVHLFYEWELQKALREFSLGVDLCPSEARTHHWYSEYLRATGQFDAAVSAMARACEIEPLSMMVNTSLALVLFYARRFDDAIAHLRRTLEMDPHFAVAHWALGMVHCQQANYHEAVAELRKASALSGRNTLILGTLGLAYGSSGKRDEARAILTEFKWRSAKQFVSAFSRASVYIGLDDRARAVEWLGRASEERATWLAYIHVHPLLDKLRPDQRFQALARRFCLGDLAAAAPGTVGAINSAERPDRSQSGGANSLVRA
jgi:DNA-binding winged helix-turn-helix (wHTH) protein/tetratricopeptide (TPR) repeat protein